MHPRRRTTQCERLEAAIAVIGGDFTEKHPRDNGYGFDRRRVERRKTAKTLD
jgi:hypothetical protein